MRGATAPTAAWRRRSPFQSTHPLRGATFYYGRLDSAEIFQSTHPLRGATIPAPEATRAWRFQSTHPLRGATVEAPAVIRRLQFQSTHPLRGATSDDYQNGAKRCISIHAPLAGCDAFVEQVMTRGLDFNPRTPCGVRRDVTIAQCARRADFNPRTPCGVRPFTNKMPKLMILFQSTHPLRGATDARVSSFTEREISIHAPLAGCDG